MIDIKKSLGQHWLHDEKILETIVLTAAVKLGDNILEIGPGLGSLTKKLLANGADIVAVEKDERLIVELSGLAKAGNLKIINQDILKFDLNSLPSSYKVVANIPYYLTSNLIRILSQSDNPPATITLLVQKEVAQRLCAEPGQLSILGVSAQVYFKCFLGLIVPAEKFTPPPKVDSQIVHMVRRTRPAFADLDSRQFFRVVKAGFSSRRKTLLNSLSGGLNLPKSDIQKVLESCQINPSTRPQELSPEQWVVLANKLI